MAARFRQGALPRTLTYRSLRQDEEAQNAFCVSPVLISHPSMGRINKEYGNHEDLHHRP
jgi:hypothetical protein